MSGDRGTIERYPKKAAGAVIGGVPTPGGVPPGDGYGLVFEGGLWVYRPMTSSVLIARLGTGFAFGSSWYPQDFIGLNTTTASTSSFGLAGGYVCTVDDEDLDHWVLVCESVSGTAGNCYIYKRSPGQAEVDTAIAIPIDTVAQTTFNLSDVLSLQFGDMVAVRLTDAFGFTPNACSLWARRKDKS